MSLPFATTTINSEGKKVITKAGFRSIAALFVFIILPLIQYFFQEKEAVSSEDRIISNLTSKYQNSVKEIQSNSKQNYDNTIEVLATNLGTYKLALDAAKESIVDSIPSPIPSQIPRLKILDISNGNGFKLEKKDSGGYTYSIPFYSGDATSCCFKINCYVVGHKQGNDYKLKKTFNNLLESDETILNDITLVTFITLDSMQEFDMIYLVVIGKYKDANTNVTYPINEVCSNNTKTNTFGWLEGKSELRKNIMKAIKK